MSKWNKKQAEKASPLGEMIAERVDVLDDATIENLKKLSNLAPLLNIAAGKEIKIDSTTGVVSVADKA